MIDVHDMARTVFYRMLGAAGRVFLHVRHMDGVSIGKRGFKNDEKRNGLTLVFNESMDFSWDEDGIHATLFFGAVSERCIIPNEAVSAVYSPELGVQFIMAPADKLPQRNGPPGKTDKKLENSKVIRVDFANTKAHKNQGDKP